MPDWGWVLALFVGMSAAYWAGHALGNAEFHPPHGNVKAWMEAKRYDMDCRKEIALRQSAMNHEETMKLIERGALDNLEPGKVVRIVGEETEEDENGNE